MAVRGTRVSSLFDKYKSQGMSDSDAMEKAISESSNETIASREKGKKKQKKPGLFKRLKMGITGKAPEKDLSPAGREYKRGELIKGKKSKYKRSK